MNFQAGKYKAIVPISGGKDSQCCLALACNEFGADNVMGLFCDTKFEHPDTYAHIERLKKIYSVSIVTICAGSVEEKVRRYKLFPGMGGSRHCTKELKIIPTKKYLKEFAKINGPIEVWYGMRSEESSARATRYAAIVSTETYPAHEVMPGQYPKYLHKLGVVFRLPILDWEEWQVFKFIKGYENPLYSKGFSRVGCFPCLAAGDEYKQKAFIHDDFGREQREKVKALENDIGKSVFTTKKAMARENPNQRDLFEGCKICEI